ncbi:MAG: peptidylprolyl isomerase [Gammaproteobacteria bacterium]|nr:peptidylprolyl isomerase [Gammaproteobacteria bacterium]
MYKHLHLLNAFACATLLCSVMTASAESERGHDSGAGIFETLTSQKEQALMSAIPLDTVIANVNGRTLTQRDYNDYLRIRLGRNADKTPLDREAIISELVKRELIVQDAHKKKVDEHHDFITEMKVRRYDLLVAFGVRDYLEKHPFSEEQIKREYDKRVAAIKLAKEYKASHILVKTREEAGTIIAELTKSEDQNRDFAKLAEKKSLDAGSNKKGGDLGWFIKERMVRPFADAISVMEKGEYSREPVQTDFGWHVILLLDSRKITPPSLESIKEGFRERMQTQQMLDYVSELQKNAKVEIYQAVVNSKTETASPAK